MSTKLPDLILGSLPVDVINRTLGMELDAGLVMFSSGAQVHAARRHPNEYQICLPHIALIVAAPLYIGDDHRNPGKIEMIGRIQTARSLVLVSINVEIADDGFYHLCSFYPISDAKAQSRRAKGFLRVAQKS